MWMQPAFDRRTKANVALIVIEASSAHDPNGNASQNRRRSPQDVCPRQKEMSDCRTKSAHDPAKPEYRLSETHEASYPRRAAGTPRDRTGYHLEAGRLQTVCELASFGQATNDWLPSAAIKSRDDLCQMPLGSPDIEGADHVYDREWAHCLKINDILAATANALSRSHAAEHIASFLYAFRTNRNSEFASPVAIFSSLKPIFSTKSMASLS